MSKHTYELTNLNGTSCGTNDGDVGKIIGKGAKNLRKIISESWSFYEKIQSSPKRVDEEKPTLKIILKNHENGITVEIISESKIMQKLAKRTLNKHVERIFKENPLKTHHYVTEFPDRLVGKIIGKGGTGLKKILNDISHQKGQCMIHEDDVDTAKTARIIIEKTEEFKTDENEQSSHIVKFVKSRTDYSFLGWPLSPDDNYENHISVTLSFKYGSKPFVDKSLYIERFSEIVSDRLNQVKDEDNQKMDEINEILDLDSDEEF